MPIDLKQMCVYDKVTKYSIQAECREPLHIGTGSGRNGEVLVHPVEERPFVQATGLAGAFREYYRYDEELERILFGAACQEEENAAGEGSKVFFTDGFFSESAVYTELRPRIKIDRITATSQTAELKGSRQSSGQKFEMESVAAGSVFSFSIYLYEKEGEKNLDKELELGLQALHRGEIQLGGQKSNGCGYTELLSVRKAVYHLCDQRDRKLWAEEKKEMTELLPGLLEEEAGESRRIHFELSGKTAGSILVKSIAVTEYGKDAPDAVNIRNHRRDYILPGSSVKGAVRSQIEKIASYMGLKESCVQKIFGTGADDRQEGSRGKIRFYDCVIGESEDNDLVRIQHRIHIDKFTGGVMYGGLFSEKPAYGELTLRVDLEEEMDQAGGLLLLALRDLALGIFPLGSGSSIGRGYLDGDTLIVRKGNQKLIEIDLKAGKTVCGQEVIGRYLDSLQPAGES